MQDFVNASHGYNFGHEDFMTFKPERLEFLNKNLERPHPIHDFENSEVPSLKLSDLQSFEQNIKEDY